MKNKNLTDFYLNSAPIAWIDYSEELKEIAELISKSSGITVNRYPDISKTLSLERGYFLNYGFSIETLIKGLLIAENPNYISNGKISKEITGHNLIVLSQKSTSLTFDKSERKILEILSKAIPYWGRYPIPKKASQIESRTKFTERINSQLNKLWFKIGKCLYNKIKFGWSSGDDFNTGPYISSTFETEQGFKESIKKLNQLKKDGDIKFLKD